ncbi:MAG: acyl-CoA reductase [Bacteroidota bacterium]
MKITERIETFSELGSILHQYVSDIGVEKHNNKIDSAILQAEKENPWFTRENILYQMKEISENLKKDRLESWINSYPLFSDDKIKTIAVVMPGNIPLVGFHDFLSVLITGNKFLGKSSSKDKILIELIADILNDINPEFSNFIRFENNSVKDFDAIIATGSNNSSMHFQYYFKKYPHIIRKHRNSVAVLDGKETETDLSGLADDIFLYFGLGCRNVSKILVPKDTDIRKILPAFEKFNGIINHNKYANNYSYNSTVYYMNNIKFLDTGFLLLKHDLNISSPIAVIYFDYYKNISNLVKYFISNNDQMQCIVSNIPEIQKRIQFGCTQKPELSDYSDGVDTIDFLISLK